MSPSGHDLTRERQWVCARRLSERRHELGLTQLQVVERLAQRGVVASNRALSAMEHGQGVDLGRLPELASVLDCSITYLLGLTRDAHSWEPDASGAVQPIASRAGSSGPPKESWILGPELPDRRGGSPLQPR